MNGSKMSLATKRDWFEKCTREMVEADVELARTYAAWQAAKERYQRAQLLRTDAWGDLVMASVQTGETPPKWTR